MKTTVRLPDPLLEELRARSREEGRSINATIIDLLWRGVGIERPAQQLEKLLGDLVAKPASGRFDPELARTLHAELGVAGKGLSEALEWTREDQS